MDPELAGRSLCSAGRRPCCRSLPIAERGLDPRQSTLVRPARAAPAPPPPPCAHPRRSTSAIRSLRRAARPRASDRRAARAPFHALGLPRRPRPAAGAAARGPSALARRDPRPPRHQVPRRIERERPAAPPGDRHHKRIASISRSSTASNVQKPSLPNSEGLEIHPSGSARLVSALRRRRSRKPRG
jgi:hypothetical protein